MAFGKKTFRCCYFPSERSKNGSGMHLEPLFLTTSNENLWHPTKCIIPIQT
jgi:hypothetical protein